MKYKNKQTGEIINAVELTRTFRIDWKFGDETVFKFISREKFLKD